MKNFVVLILLIISFTLFSQRTKKIVIDDYDLFAKHEFYVLKKDKSTKHGPYKSTWVNGIPREEGFYHMGKKDSLWTYYSQLKALVASRGYYNDGLKVDVWEYFDAKGNIINRYNHSTGYLSYTTFKDTVKSYTIRLLDSLGNIDTVMTGLKLDRSPIYLEGDKRKFRTIQDHIVYPQKAIDNNTSGTVMISFYVNIYGKAIDHQIVSGIGGGCDKEALRVVKLIPNEWAPAIYQGQIVEALIFMPITFVMN